jgi:serine/threonine protein kinase
VPEVPQWLSAEAKDFLASCLIRRASDRCTAAQLLDHPFLAFAGLDAKLGYIEVKWVSPKSTLDAAFWEFSESENEEADDDLSRGTADRMKALACPASTLPDWDSDEGWIDVLSAAPTEVSDAVAMPAEETADLDDAIASEEQTEDSAVLDITTDSSDDSVLKVRDAGDGSVWAHNGHQPLEIFVCHELAPCKLFCGRSMIAIDFVPAQILCSVPLFLCSLFFLFGLPLPPIATRSVSKTNTTSCSPRRLPKPILPPR